MRNHLTARQIEVMRALVEHSNASKAAAILGIKRGTVAEHTTAIQERLGTWSRAHSAAVMEAQGLLVGVPLPNGSKEIGQAIDVIRRHTTR